MLIAQGTSSSLVTRIYDNAGVPHTGISVTAVSAYIRKHNAVAFSAFALTVSNFHNLGNGYYSIDLSTTDTNTVGSLHILLQSALFEDQLVAASIVASTASIPVGPSVPLTTGSVYGILRNADGSAVAGATVSAVPVGTPNIVSSGTEGVALTNAPLTTRSDATGYFILTGLVGVMFDVYIPAVNYRASVVMPSGSENIFDLGA